jgi:hypothetical protein
VCTLVHGIASVRAVEDALKYDIPNHAFLPSACAGLGRRGFGIEGRSAGYG